MKIKFTQNSIINNMDGSNLISKKDAEIKFEEIINYIIDDFKKNNYELLITDVSDRTDIKGLSYTFKYENLVFDFLVYNINSDIESYKFYITEKFSAISSDFFVSDVKEKLKLVSMQEKGNEHNLKSIIIEFKKTDVENKSIKINYI